MGFPAWVWVLVGAAVMALVTVFRGRGALAKVNPWPALPEPRAGDNCQRCHHWNLDEGQETLRRHPAFLQAAAVLTPNQMVRSEKDSVGNLNAGRKLLPLAEDKWQFMGACMGHGELRHRSDICPSFVLAGSRAATKTNVGEGPGFAEPTLPPLPADVTAMDLSDVEVIDQALLDQPTRELSPAPGAGQKYSPTEEPEEDDTHGS
jgi:hypothetical protein